MELTVAQADSLIHLIDSLEIELWEQRQYAAIDSVTSTLLLEQTIDTYEAVLDEYKGARDNWFEQALKHPVVWMAVGMWVGANAR